MPKNLRSALPYIISVAVAGILVACAIISNHESNPFKAHPSQEYPSQEQGVVVVEENSTLLEDSGSFGMLKVAEGANGFVYYRDSVTDVLYLWKSAGYKGGLTTMQDPETGLPMTYTRYMDLSNMATAEE